MHIAAATGTPTLGLRAHVLDQAARVAPTGRAADWVLRPGDDMEAIGVEEAEEGCRRVLAMAADAQ